jgi:hypothetical protein
VVKAVGAGPIDRKDYRRADWLDCSERASANITLSSEVELKEGKRKRVWDTDYPYFYGNDNLTDKTRSIPAYRHSRCQRAM